MSQILTDEQLVALGRYQLGLGKLLDATRRLNNLAAENHLTIRAIPEFPIGMSNNDAIRIAFEHQVAEVKQRAAA
jgi:hypothetical protein